MAGDWMKFEKATLDKPEVFEMAGILGIDPDAVVGKLLRVWDWFDDQSLDGYAPVTLAAQLNRNTGYAGFTEAMQKVGWLVIENDRLKIPNFSRHNGQTAKDRALSSKRMAKHRGKCYGDSVTPTVTKTQPEKRREEKSIIPPNPQGGFSLDVSESKKPDQDQIAVGKLLGRRESTKWTSDEIKLLKAIKPIHPDDLAMMQRFYGAEIPKDADYRRTTVERLLKHWNGELDKARIFTATKP